MSTGTDNTLNPDAEGENGLAPGTMFGPYEVVGLLGKGGMGSVYEATHTLLHKRVALKTLHTSAIGNGLARQRFMREGRAASRLDHPHVVSVSDVGIQDGVPYLVMELLSGEDLDALLKREKHLSVERTVEIMVPVCTAVQAAHDAGIIHRDLKPANIFLARNAFGQVVPKVLDFGVSKVTEGNADQALTGSRALMGTSFYMSPEQAQGSRDVDGRSDQYTLGAILYECVTGKRAFSGEALFGVLLAVTSGRFERPRARQPDLPERFEALILRAMHLDPPERFASCDELARELLAHGDANTRTTWLHLFGTPSAAPPPTLLPDAASTKAATPRIDPSRPDTLSDTAKEVHAIGPARHAPDRVRQVVAVSAVGVLALAGITWALLPHAATAPHAAAAPTVSAELSAPSVTAHSSVVIPPAPLASPGADAAIEPSLAPAQSAVVAPPTLAPTRSIRAPAATGPVRATRPRRPASAVPGTSTPEPATIQTALPAPTPQPASRHRLSTEDM